MASESAFGAGVAPLSDKLAIVNPQDIAELLNRVKPLNLLDRIFRIAHASSMAEASAQVVLLIEQYGMCWNTVEMLGIKMSSLIAVCTIAYKYLLSFFQTPAQDQSDFGNQPQSFVMSESTFWSEIKNFFSELFGEEGVGVIGVMAPLAACASAIGVLLSVFNFGTGFVNAKKDCFLKRIKETGDFLRSFSYVTTGASGLFQGFMNSILSIFGITWVPEAHKEAKELIERAKTLLTRVKNVQHKISLEPHYIMRNRSGMNALNAAVSDVENVFKDLASLKVPLGNARELLLQLREHHKVLQQKQTCVYKTAAIKCDPVCLWLWGIPGIGKSKFKDHVIRVLSHLHGRPLTTYSRTSTDEYWSGYCGQDVVVYDEFGNHSEDIDHDELLRMRTSAAYLLNVADVESKGTPFSSIYVIICCNARSPNSSSRMKDVSPLMRRRDFLIQVQNPGLDQWMLDNRGFRPNENSDLWKDDYSHLRLVRQDPEYDINKSRSRSAFDDFPITPTQLVGAMFQLYEIREMAYEKELGAIVGHLLAEKHPHHIGPIEDTNILKATNDELASVWNDSFCVSRTSLDQLQKAVKTGLTVSCPSAIELGQSIVDIGFKELESAVGSNASGILDASLAAVDAAISDLQNNLEGVFSDFSETDEGRVGQVIDTWFDAPEVQLRTTVQQVRIVLLDGAAGTGKTTVSRTICNLMKQRLYQDCDWVTGDSRLDQVEIQHKTLVMNDLTSGPDDIVRDNLRYLIRASDNAVPYDFLIITANEFQNAVLRLIPEKEQQSAILRRITSWYSFKFVPKYKLKVLGMEVFNTSRFWNYSLADVQNVPLGTPVPDFHDIVQVCNARDGALIDLRNLPEMIFHMASFPPAVTTYVSDCTLPEVDRVLVPNYTIHCRVRSQEFMRVLNGFKLGDSYRDAMNLLLNLFSLEKITIADAYQIFWPIAKQMMSYDLNASCCFDIEYFLHAINRRQLRTTSTKLGLFTIDGRMYYITSTSESHLKFVRGPLVSSNGSGQAFLSHVRPRLRAALNGVAQSCRTLPLTEKSDIELAVMMGWINLPGAARDLINWGLLATSLIAGSLCLRQTYTDAKLLHATKELVSDLKTNEHSMDGEFIDDSIEDHLMNLIGIEDQKVFENPDYSKLMRMQRPRIGKFTRGTVRIPGIRKEVQPEVETVNSELIESGPPLDFAERLEKAIDLKSKEQNPPNNGRRRKIRALARSDPDDQRVVVECRRDLESGDYVAPEKIVEKLKNFFDQYYQLLPGVSMSIPVDLYSVKESLDVRPVSHEAEAVPFPGSIEIAKVVSRNIVQVLRGHERRVACWAIMIEGTVGCTVLHAWIEKGPMWIRFHVNGQSTDQEILQIDSDPARDLVIFQVKGVAHRQFRSMLRYIPSSETSIFRNNLTGFMVTPMSLAYPTMDFIWKALRFQELRPAGNFKPLDQGWLYKTGSVSLSLDTPILTTAGHCGSPLFTLSTDTYPFVGFHKSANQLTACGADIYREDFEPFLENKPQSLGPQLEIMDHLSIKLYPRDKILKVQNVSIVGTSAFTNSFTNKTSFWNSPLAISLGEDDVKMEPAILNTSDPRLYDDDGNMKRDIVLSELLKWNQPVLRNFDGRVLLNVMRGIISHVTELAYDSDYTTRIMTKIEALNGTCDFDVSNPIERSTSPGCPWKYVVNGTGKMPFLTFVKDKNGAEFWKIDERKHAGRLLSHSIDKIIDICKRGNVPAVVFETCMKDEPRPLKRIYEEPKTRIFTPAPFDYCIAHRMYFHQGVALLRQIRDCHPVKVGIVPQSTEWNDMVQELLAMNPDKCFCPDYKNFDATHPRILVMFASILYRSVMKATAYRRPGEGYNRFKERIEREDDIRQKLMFADSRPFVHYREYLLQFEGGIFSGKPTTTDDNSWINLAYLAYAFLVLAEEHAPQLATYGGFRKYVACVVFGDDAQVHPHPTVSDWYNLQTVHQVLKRDFGVVILGNNKDPKNIPALIPFSESEFLKRKHKLVDDQYIGALGMTSFLKMLNWTQGTRHVYCKLQHLGEHDVIDYDVREYAANLEALENTCRSALDEAILHGYKFYDKILKHVKEKMKDLGVRCIFPSAEEKRLERELPLGLSLL
ncbi:hypothetical protein 1 [Hubei myriapoda virus 2]|uniref:hypothetical protein 1 n=1 Tax=Hubei myriapoda virus 2 TaxID=1922931 RepID=UPI00090AC36A|nr:hypothetical protein 1 [Hubei myriapoda virus 2]APG78381.1 hypothetical protein 1 [Hubei myriapoda virus 2]